MKVAIVHDWINVYAGAERVVLALHELFPEAPIYTSVYDAKAVPQFKDLDVRTSFLQQVPLAKKRHRWFPTARARAFESFDFSDFDVVISSASAEAKGIVANESTLHISYCHTPTRYYWSHYDEYLKRPGFGMLDPLVRVVAPYYINKMRKWDYAAAQKVDHFIANSDHVGKRIQKYYDRKSATIYPPVDVERFRSTSGQREGFLVVGRQVPYKRVDLAVRACTELEAPLTVVGDGPEHNKLKKLAGPTVKFIKNATDQEVAEAYRKAEALLFAAKEDFGIVPVEAMASGTPVIAYGEGGATETVMANETGLFFNEQSVESLRSAINDFNVEHFNSEAIATYAQRFSKERFHTNMKKLLSELGVEIN